MRNDFAIFILTHGRPDTQLTLKTLLACGYTGRWYLVLDDQDDTIQKYIDNFGADRIIVFNMNFFSIFNYLIILSVISFIQV